MHKWASAEERYLHPEQQRFREGYEKYALLKDFDSPISIDVDLYPEVR